MRNPNSSLANRWCFRVDEKEKVDAFYAQGITDAGQPKLRAEYHEIYYATFLIDSSEKRIKRENRVNINTQK